MRLATNPSYQVNDLKHAHRLLCERERFFYFIYLVDLISEGPSHVREEERTKCYAKKRGEGERHEKWREGEN